MESEQSKATPCTPFRRDRRSRRYGTARCGARAKRRRRDAGHEEQGPPRGEPHPILLRYEMVSSLPGLLRDGRAAVRNERVLHSPSCSEQSRPRDCTRIAQNRKRCASHGRCGGTTYAVERSRRSTSDAAGIRLRGGENGCIAAPARWQSSRSSLRIISLSKDSFRIRLGHWVRRFST